MLKGVSGRVEVAIAGKLKASPGTFCNEGRVRRCQKYQYLIRKYVIIIQVKEKIIVVKLMTKYRFK